MKFNIRGKLLLVYIAIISLLSIVWLIDYFTHTYLANEVGRMYTHPLAVTRASLKANTDIMAMHRSMKDVVLASNDEELRSAIDTVDGLERKVVAELIIVQKRILGDEGKKLAANTYKAFKDWKEIRQEVISLVQAGKVDEAIAITKGKGADHVRYLDKKAEQLWMYAENKGRSFNEDAQAYVKSSTRRNILAFLTVILLTSSLALYISFSISSRLKKLKAAARKMAGGELNQSVQIEGGDEIAELGEEFNFMAIQLYDSYSSLERSAGELKREITERKKAEALVRKNEERLRAILDNTISVVYMKDVNGEYILINSTFEKLFKISREEIVGKTDYDIFTKKIADAFKENDQKVLELCKPLTMEEIAPHDDGLHTYISVKFPLLGDDGRPYAICGISMDITERKKIEEALKLSEKQHREIIASTQEGYWLVNKDRETVNVNESLCQMLGYTREEMLSKSPLEFVDEENAKIFKKQMGTMETSPHRNYEITLLRKDGAPLPAIFNATTILDREGKVEGAFAFVTDISDLKEKEDELIKAKREAEDATRLKDKFVSLVAHDLRSPFTSILGTMHLLIDDRSLNLKPKQRELMSAVLQSGNRMVAMIKEMLDISRLKTGKIELKPKFFDGHLMSGAVMGAISHLVNEKGIKIVNEVPEGSRLYADTTLFFEVISNLVSNSVKFCGKGDTITLFNPPGRPTTIAVKDTGPGISEKMLPDIFKSEVKTTSLGSLGEPGTGLGLPYSYDIMHAHGGDIKVESAKGEGSVFYAELSYVKPRVLLVDDEKIVRQMLSLFLGELEVDIIEAGNGQEAIGVIEQYPPHLIVTDINMPEMDGFALLEAIKGNEKTKSIPVIVVTSDSQEDTREKAVRLGADDFILKPVSKKKLIARIRKYVI